MALALVAAGLVLVGPAPAGAAPTRHQVVKAQKRLNALRCDAGPADGRAGDHTRAAVVRFQSRHGLPQTGDLTWKVRQRLHRPDAKRCDRRPVPRYSGAGRRIVISQHQNWLWLVRADGSVRAQGPVIDNPRELRPGTYATGSYCGRRARILRNQDLHYRLWLDRFVRFAPCGIGFHRIPRWKSNGAQIHADWRLGTNQRTSDGCIRLSRAMSGQVWDFTARGRTKVRVK